MDSTTGPELQAPQSANPLRVLCWSDVQYPFLDKQADKVLEAFIQEFKPDIAILNGDGLDAYSISKFTPNPERRDRLADDVGGFKAYLSGKARILPAGVTKHFNGGNHEDRIRKYIADKAPELAGLPGFSLEEMLDLREAGWGYTPYWNPVATSGSPGYNLHGVLFTHGTQVTKWSAMTAKAHWERYGGSGVIGHTHRLGEFYHRDYRGEHQNKWIEGGCLCSLDPEYATYPDWQHGFVAGYMWPGPDDSKTWRYDLRPVPIVDGEAVWEGRRIAP